MAKILGPSSPLSNRHVRSPIALDSSGHREGGPVEPGHGDSPGACRGGTPAALPLEASPEEAPGEGPRQSPLWGAKKEGEMVGGRRSQGVSEVGVVGGSHQMNSSNSGAMK
jgi:hypothetical protein